MKNEIDEKNKAKNRDSNCLPEYEINQRSAYSKVWSTKPTIGKQESDRIRQWKISVLEKVRREAIEKQRTEREMLRQEVIQEYRIAAQVFIAEEIAKARFQKQLELE